MSLNFNESSTGDDNDFDLGRKLIKVNSWFNSFESMKCRATQVKNSVTYLVYKTICTFQILFHYLKGNILKHSRNDIIHNRSLVNKKIGVLVHGLKKKRISQNENKIPKPVHIIQF